MVARKNLVILSLICVVVLISGIYSLYDDDKNHNQNKEGGENVLSMSWENTPSQNLAIKEGRYEDAKKSIEEINA